MDESRQQSAKLDTRLASGGRLHSHRGEHLILLAVVGLLVAEEDIGLGAVLGIVGGQLAVQLLLLLAPLLLQALLLALLLLADFSQHDVALVVVLHVCMGGGLLLAFWSPCCTGSDQPRDQLDCPPGPWWTLTLVLLVSPILNWLRWAIFKQIQKEYENRLANPSISQTAASNKIKK